MPVPDSPAQRPWRERSETEESILRRVHGPVRAVVRFRHAGCMTETLPGRSYAALVSSDSRWDVFVMHGETDEDVDRWLRAFQHHVGAAPQVLVRRPAAAMIRSRHRPDDVDRAAADADATRLVPTFYREGGEQLTFVTTSGERLRELLARLDVHGDAQLLEADDARVESLTLAAGDLTADLTPRQLDVLLRAVSDGYYATPRRTNAERQAAHHGVARATWEEHLRKAEERVLRALSERLTRHPFIERIAQRRVGRPPGRARDEA